MPKPKNIVRKIGKASKTRVEDRTSVLVNFDGETVRLDPSTIEKRLADESLSSTFAKAKKIRVLQVIRLKRWPAKSLAQLIHLLKLVATKTTFVRSTKIKKSYATLFDALLPSLKKTEKPSNFETWLTVILVVIALTYGVAPEAACTQVAAAAKEAGIKGLPTGKLCKKVEGIQSALGRELLTQAAPEEAIPAKKVWRGLPSTISDELVIPPSWVATTDGIMPASSDDPASHLLPPMLIGLLLRNPMTDELFVDIYWKANNAWSHKTVPRSIIADRRKFVALADFVVRVTSNNAGDIIQFLADFEGANLTALAEGSISPQLGWLDSPDGPQFLLGHRLLTARSDDED
jgi:hypothetical protein